MEAYIIIPQQFVNKYNNGKLKIDINQFNAVQTVDGRWVTSLNSLNEFEAQFGEINVNKKNVQITYLDTSDFPQYDMEGNRIN